jgi:DNA polymerase III alpha subunit
MAAQLTVEGADSKYETVTKYESGVEHMGISLLPPDINKAMPNYVVSTNRDGRKQIMKGLKGIKGLGDDVYNDILGARKEHKFRDMYDYCFRAPTASKSDIFTPLLDAGAFDEWSSKDGYLSRKLGRKANRRDLESEYVEMAKRAQNERKEKGMRKEEKDGIGFAFAVPTDDGSADKELGL